MQTIHKNDAEKLTQMAASLTAIAERLRGKTAQISAETRERVKQYEVADICLWCLKHKPGDRFTRGLCATHYNEVNKKIGTGELDEVELLELGRIAEAQSGGRKSEHRVTVDKLAPLPPLAPVDGKVRGADVAGVGPHEAHQKHGATAKERKAKN